MATEIEAEERAVLLACLEWQLEAGCDGWLASDIEQAQGSARGWRQADSLVRTMLDALSPQPSSPQRSSPQPSLPHPSSPQPSSSATRQRGDVRFEVSRSPSQHAPLLAPVDAVVEARKAAEACETLEELEQAVQSFELCPLKKGARNTVFAEGNPDADLVVVGEAPGREEDEQGKPFVGASGQLLSRMLEAIGIKSREQYRITNLVYWRPPGNRNPDSDEVAVCYPFFLRHMALVKPRWILLLGNVAMQHVLSERRGITKVHGQFFPLTLLGSGVGVGAVVALPSFHPSYLLRTPAKKAAAWHDLLVLRRAMQKGRMAEDGIGVA